MHKNYDLLFERLDKARLSDVLNKMDEQQRGELFVLKYLLKNTNIEITPGFITDAYGVSTARTASILNQLESKGYIERKKSINDGRKYIIELTDIGIEFIEERTKKSKKIIIDMINHIGIEEFEHFVSIVEKMHMFFCQGFKEGE